ncbi:MAG: glycosyltransferase, partial [Acidaminococcaceae bacterium]|nr:glycosyltransferase [Acidaminococcaceae bacterium]
MSAETVLYMVIPCYNEQEVLPDSAEKIKNKITQLMQQKKISRKSKICFINDGSRDRTWEIIQNLCGSDPVYSGICLAHNEGHQNAVLAGLMTVKPYCDA